MRISFDLDDTLICYGGVTACEPRLWWPLRLVIRDEPLRAGASRLARALCERGHELWVYTTSHRSPRFVKVWLRLHGVQIHRVINGVEHNKCFGQGSTPTKRPDAFGIDLHICISTIHRALQLKESYTAFVSAWLAPQRPIGLKSS